VGEEADYKAKIDKCHQIEALLRAEVESLINKKYQAASSGGRRSKKKQ
jgi:hypothetical protein